MDTLQYHPTGVAWPEAILGELIPEKTRSIGGQLVNPMSQRFIYELEPRDVVASALIRECSEGGGRGHAYGDLWSLARYASNRGGKGAWHD
jgi:aspartate oxidase